MSPITPCLWFDDNLEEAMEFYVKIFPNSSIGSISHYGEAGPGEPGKVMAGETVDAVVPLENIVVTKENIGSYQPAY